MSETVKIIDLSFNGTVGFAMQQNHVPVIRQLAIKNYSDNYIQNLQISITTDPDIAEEWTAKIDSIIPDGEHILNGIDLRLSASKLFELTERINGTLNIVVSDDSGILTKDTWDLSFLSYDEWSGANTFPEFLAAFCTPNHPYITEIIKKAGLLLEKWTGSPSFTGYQSKNPNNVRKQMAAIYGALQQENITYLVPPASFEENGQRVRLSGTIMEQKIGTCLDLALLYAGCLEAVGLHPMVVIIKGHAFTGCWLEEESFAECVQDDVSALTKRIAQGIGEICVVETTSFTSGKNMSFENAVSAAEDHLRKPDDFIYLVDIARSRGGGIRPIPQRREDGTFSFEDSQRLSNAVTDAPEEMEILGKLQQVDTVEFTRQQIWERKLLDLSLRNSLLNFRVTKNAIQLFVNSLSDLEDALSDGAEFQIMHRPHDLQNSPRDTKIYESINKESIWNTLIQAEFGQHRIRTYLDESTLSSAVISLYRSAKSSMEENGANTLYLAMGFLKWYESDVSEKPRYAPLVMIPVDIIRKSAQRGYVFRLRDEEPQFNVTLLEMLRMNFGITVTGLDPLPTDEHGINLKQVFHVIRQMIMGKSRWDVEELAFMGIFSFSQFIMWNDIRNRVDDLKRNKVVKSLISGKMEWESDISFLSPEELDNTVTPVELAMPISADSSQLAAIHAGGKGQSFVLHGPPGTGKSQTITNIIANALYQGKSVLFVAEKMAALDVVEKRLNAIGLGPFCLEIHSNKARKKDVLDQLDKALNVGRIKPPGSYKEEAAAILELRRELNKVVQELHKPRHFGASLYEAISRAEKYAEYGDCIAFTNEQMESLTPQKYARWEELCTMLSSAGLSCGGVHDHALQEIKNSRYSQDARAFIETLLKDYRSLLSELNISAKQTGEKLDLGEIKTYRQYKALAEICIRLKDAVRVPTHVLTYKDLPLIQERINTACTAGRRRDEIGKELCADYSEQLLAFDAQTALLQWNQAEASWFLPKMLGKSKIAKSVKLYARDQKGFDKAKTTQVLELVAEHKKMETTVNESAPLLADLFGVQFSAQNCDWTLLITITSMAVQLQHLIKAAVGNGGCLNTAAQLFGESPDAFASDRLSALMSKLDELEAELTEHFMNGFEQWHNEADWIAAMSERASRWSENIGGLRDYCGYLQVKTELDAEGLQAVSNVLESGMVDESKLVGTFLKCISRRCSNMIIDNTPILSSFRGTLFSQKIEKFRALCKEYEMLTKQEIVATLSAQIPVLSTGVSGSSEIGILQRAIKSGGRMMPVRKLFESIPTLLRKLCPCMLMSPISVAQYLDPKHPPFDMVVFDEASQLPTSEAVGAIARGSELIVVGDPKQLPPTSFFTSAQVDEDNIEKEDLESVLDDCLALSMPQEHLLWHYRSRHESLIAFSNKKYYENKLYTFPSPNNLISQVRLIPVEGFYDRGKTKQNQGEAEAIVAEIVRRLSDPVLKNRSIGVVTFSSVQQNLIADMLEAEFNKNSDLDDAANNVEEPIFVKNLENVQGDERDVILFSVGYGPDAQGRVALNFGPLNREGGWRRLNVAVTRARYEMLIFSVLKPEQIDLNRTRSDGLAGLKAFLEFAARGVTALQESGGGKMEYCGVTEIIAEAIRSLGYAVNTNIGSSGYQVDIGIVHPDKPDTYLLGILCDSEKYHSAGTALDRNQTQDMILRGLGWRLSRVWVLDWWDNSEKELKRIKEDIEVALKESKSESAPIEEPKKPVSVQTLDFEKMEEMTSQAVYKKYEVAPLGPLTNYLGNTDFFASNESTRIIKYQVETVLKVESPVCRDVLCKRILEAWGISRMGPRINRRFDEIMSAMNVRTTISGDNVFCWNTETNPQQYDEFRVPSEEEKTRRNMEHIPPEEIACVIKSILNQQIGLLEDDLEREAARIFGFARCTEAMQKYIQAGLAIAIQKNWAVIDGDRVNVFK